MSCGPGQTDGVVRLYTHNIYARRVDWLRRRELLVDGIAQLRPDIVLNHFPTPGQIARASDHDGLVADLAVPPPPAV